MVTCSLGNSKDDLIFQNLSIGSSHKKQLLRSKTVSNGSSCIEKHKNLKAVTQVFKTFEISDLTKMLETFS